MTALAVVFGKVLQLSYHIGMSNYILAVIIFTFCTKILLLPISLWTQKNSIKMVKMQPQINEIKIQYFGDKDTIADKTTELYKEEKYNPFIGIIPLIVQIIILMGIIEVVKQPHYAGLNHTDMMVMNIEFYAYPYVKGGLYWSMPLWVGLSALVLSLFQNRINPLQHEQSLTGKLGTMTFSIGISLALGAFVPVGVGFYWICSNLLVIFQQALLNVFMNPNKYIDHERMEESRKQLGEMQSIGRNRKLFSKDAYAAKEKADYKRFFSIANKHLVFYSEGSGFYKYYEKIIDYLLIHSNVIIHYVTSDPKDDIFNKAQENARIKGYYIGEKKLITLMMKMDADIVVMTMSDLENYHIKRSYIRKDIEYIYIFHYPLSTHMVLHTGALDHYDTILCVGDFQFKEIRKQEELYSLPCKRLISCGYGQLEKLKEAYDGVKHEKHLQKKILVAPSWQEKNILDSCINELLEELLGKGCQVVVRPHPEYVKRYKDRLEVLIDTYRDYQGGDLHFELDFKSNTSIFDSDIVITDWSGTAYEFSFVTGKPSVFIDTPMKVNNPEYMRIGIEPLEITLRNEVGIRISTDELKGCHEKIFQLMENEENYAAKIFAVRNRYIANFGFSGEIGGRYIINSLKEKAQRRKEG